MLFNMLMVFQTGVMFIINNITVPNYISYINKSTVEKKSQMISTTSDLMKARKNKKKNTGFIRTKFLLIPCGLFRHKGSSTY